jgi:glycosyltransferase involved in cell wall biosynthesis
LNSINQSVLFAIDGLEYGGGERGFLQLIRGLPCERYNIHVATSPEGNFFKVLTGMGIDVIPLNLKKRVRVVSTIQMPVEGFDVGPLRKNVYRFFDRFSERYVDRFVAVSEVLRKTLTDQHKIPEGKVVKIYNGIEIEEYGPNGKEVRSQKSEVRREFGLAKDAPVIGAIGRMVWQKGFEYLIQAIPDIVRDVPDTKFLLVGDGPLRESIEALGKELRVKDNMIFTGFRRDIRKILSAVDLLGRAWRWRSRLSRQILMV